MKTLKISFPEKCIGCELCIMEVQRQLGLVGLEGSPIRVFRKDVSKGVSFSIDIDPNQISQNNINVENIRKICPTGVFTVEEIDE